MDFDHADGICDPDLEARLYAEIHYSNETYPDYNVNSSSNMSNSITSSAQFDSQTLDKNNGLNSERNYNGFVDTKTNIFRQPYRTLTDDNQLSHGYLETRSNFYLRLDTQKSDRLQSEHSLIFQKQKNGAKLRPVKRITAMQRGLLLNNVNNLDNPCFRDDDFDDKNPSKSLENGLVSEDDIKNCQRGNWLNEQNSIIERENIAVQSKNTIQNVKNIHDNSTISKYNISEKNIKLLKSYPIKNKGSVNDDESDSDDSIWEVPVPPKPIPPLINLRESDESSSDEKQEFLAVEKKKLSVEINTRGIAVLSEKFNTNQSSVKAVNETIDIMKNSTNSLALSDNIILNCTMVQKGVSSLEGIRFMRESATSSIVHHNGDSITESKVIRNDKQMFEEKKSQKKKNSIDDVESWRSSNNLIEPGQSKNHMLLSANSLGDVARSQKLKNVTNENLTAQLLSPVAIQSPDIVFVRQSDLVQNKKMDSIKTTEMIKKRKLIDNYNNTSENDENTAKLLNPAKRQKKNEATTAEMSFEKYIFQPLPENIISYYNDYQSSSMIMEVSELQSRMSRQSSHWAILDADMIGFRRKGARSTCSSCHREGHRKDRCPEKSTILSCRMCGEVGHTESTCPHTMCLTCGRKYTTYRKTCQVCKHLRCVTCKSLGHEKTECPDLWRKYHQTIIGTTPSIPDGHHKKHGLKSSAELYCCNCTNRGHDYADCMKYRWSQHFVTPSFVTNYINGPYYETSERNTTNEKITHNVNYENRDKTLINERTSGGQIELQFHKLPVQQKEAIQLNQQPLPLNQSVANMTPQVMEAISSVTEQVPFQPQQESVRKKKCIFQYVSCNSNTSEWYSAVINLEKGIQYPYNRNTEPAIPKFLETHIPRNECSIEVVILQFLDETKDFEIIVRSVDSTLLTSLKLLIIQWMSSSEEDRLIVENTPVLPFNKSALVDTLTKKISLFAALTMRKGYDALTQIRNFKCQLLKGLDKRKSGKNDEELHKLILLRKEILVASVYNYNLNRNGKKLIQEVQNILLELKKNNIELSSLFYIKCLWYNFELFTGHTRSYIVDMAENWKTLASDKLKRKSLKGMSAIVKKDQFGRNLRMKMRREDRVESTAAQIKNKSKKSQTKNAFTDNIPPRTKIKKKKKLNRINQVSDEVEIIVIDDEEIKTNENSENIQDSNRFLNVATNKVLSIEQQKSTSNSVSTQLVEKTKKKTLKFLQKSNKQLKDHTLRETSETSGKTHLNYEQQSNEPSSFVLSDNALGETLTKNSNAKNEKLIITPKKRPKCATKSIELRDAEQLKETTTMVSTSLGKVKNSASSTILHELTLSSCKKRPQNICLVTSETSQESSKISKKIDKRLKKKLNRKRKAESELLRKSEELTGSTSNDEFQIIKPSRYKKILESTETLSKSRETSKTSLREKKDFEQSQVPKESTVVHLNDSLETLTSEVGQKQILNQENNQQYITKETLNKYNGVKVEITDLPRIIAQIKHRAAEGKQPGTMVFYPPQSI